MKIKNRYNDEFTFTKTDEGDVLWEGDFKWCRFAWPNNYDNAYKQYLIDEPNPISFEDFTVEVHKYDEKTYEALELSKKYGSLVKSDTTRISMVDPSGGPYIEEGMNLGRFLGEEFQNLIVHSFEKIDTGYKIITKKI